MDTEKQKKTGVEGQDNPDNTKPEDKKPTAGAKYTDEDVDKIVKKRMARMEAEKQKAVDEAEKLAKMNADQKKDYELEKAKKDLESAQQQLATFNMAKQARSMFEDEKLSVSEEDLQHVVTPEAESTEANVKWLIAHDQAIAEKVRQEMLKGKTPVDPAANRKTTKLEDMSIMEKSELLRTNPSLYNQLKERGNM